MLPGPWTATSDSWAPPSLAPRRIQQSPGPQRAHLARRLGGTGLLAGLVLCLAATIGAAPVAAVTRGGATGVPVPFQRSTAPWTGIVELYRASAFTTQPDYTTCVPTAVQIMLNLANGTSNHSTSQIASWYAWGRAHNAYKYATPGLDPVSWIGPAQHVRQLPLSG